MSNHEKNEQKNNEKLGLSYVDYHICENRC